MLINGISYPSSFGNDQQKRCSINNITKNISSSFSGKILDLMQDDSISGADICDKIEISANSAQKNDGTSLLAVRNRIVEGLETQTDPSAVSALAQKIQEQSYNIDADRIARNIVRGIY